MVWLVTYGVAYLVRIEKRELLKFCPIASYLRSQGMEWMSLFPQKEMRRDVQ